MKNSPKINETSNETKFYWIRIFKRAEFSWVFCQATAHTHIIIIDVMIDRIGDGVVFYTWRGVLNYYSTWLLIFFFCNSIEPRSQSFDHRRLKQRFNAINDDTSAHLTSKHNWVYWTHIKRGKNKETFSFFEWLYADWLVSRLWCVSQTQSQSQWMSSQRMGHIRLCELLFTHKSLNRPAFNEIFFFYSLWMFFSWFITILHDFYLWIWIQLRNPNS